MFRSTKGQFTRNNRHGQDSARRELMVSSMVGARRHCANKRDAPSHLFLRVTNIFKAAYILGFSEKSLFGDLNGYYLGFG